METMGVDEVMEVVEVMEVSKKFVRVVHTQHTLHILITPLLWWGVWLAILSSFFPIFFFSVL